MNADAINAAIRKLRRMAEGNEPLKLHPLPFQYFCPPDRVDELREAIEAERRAKGETFEPKTSKR